MFRRSFIIALLCVVLHTVNAQSAFHKQLADSALTLIKDKVSYDPSYFTIKYPNGDVPSDKGVCTDVVIRAYRKMGIDLQKEVHEDMSAHFSLYPKIWGLSGTDKNIDHRRVPNLMTFFKEKEGHYLSLKNQKIIWKGISFVGIWVVLSPILELWPIKSRIIKRPLIIHNIGAGQVLEDCLFRYKIIGHFRYQP
jgi:uncharacterized protein YijF (DUF1287 family)